MILYTSEEGFDFRTYFGEEGRLGGVEVWFGDKFEVLG
jgi:hypothetical protein